MMIRIAKSTKNGDVVALSAMCFQQYREGKIETTTLWSYDDSSPLTSILLLGLRFDPGVTISRSC